jgi:diguanylate cyclase (GGDEF)-like protein
MKETFLGSKFSSIFLILLPLAALLFIFLYENYTSTLLEIHNILGEHENSHALIVQLEAIIDPLNNLTLQISIALFILLSIGYIRLFSLFVKRNQSFLDPNTKIFNRKYYQEVMRTLNPNEYQILLLHIENFNTISQRYDEEITNILVKSVAHRVSRIIRNHDIFILFEDATFLLFYKHKKDEKADILAQRILSVVTTQPIVAEGLYIKADIKIAINSQPDQYQNLTEAINKTKEELASIQLNSYKKAHTNPLDSSQTSRTIFELQEALKQHRIVPFYQAIYDATTMQIIAYELLARVTMPNNELLKASQFIPLISNSPVAIDLDMFMFDEAIKQIKEHSLSCHINLHVNTLCHEDMKHYIQTTLQNNLNIGLKLCIEINGLHQNRTYLKENVELNITQLKNLGVTVALDNFDLNSIDFKDLLYCNPDILKLDIKTILNDPYNIISMCKKMDIKTVIKSIEHNTELQHAKKSATDYVQGYFLDEPKGEIVAKQ